MYRSSDDAVCHHRISARISTRTFDFKMIIRSQKFEPRKLSDDCWLAESKSLDERYVFGSKEYASLFCDIANIEYVNQASTVEYVSIYSGFGNTVTSISHHFVLNDDNLSWFGATLLAFGYSNVTSNKIRKIQQLLKDVSHLKNRLLWGTRGKV